MPWAIGHPWKVLWPWRLRRPTGTAGDRSFAGRRRSTEARGAHAAATGWFCFAMFPMGRRTCSETENFASERGFASTNQSIARTARDGGASRIGHRLIVSEGFGAATGDIQKQLQPRVHAPEHDGCGILHPRSRRGPLPKRPCSFSPPKVCPAWSTLLVQRSERLDHDRPRVPRRRGRSLSAGAASSSGKAAGSLISGIARCHADSDGVLTGQEWKSYAERLFQRSDVNGDDVLDREEFPTLGKYEQAQSPVRPP